MQLSVREVAGFCEASENEVYRWIEREGLPAQRMNGAFRVNSVELLEWSAVTRRPISPTILQTLNGASVEESGLKQALEAGGIVYDVHGTDAKAVFTNAVEDLSLSGDFDRESLVELLVAREALGSTFIGNGVAIPHPRRPVVLPGAKSIARLCFLAEPIRMGATDTSQVDTLFFLICPTVREHQQLLAQLANVLSDDTFQGMLQDRPVAETILRELGRVEKSFRQST